MDTSDTAVVLPFASKARKELYTGPCARLSSDLSKETKGSLHPQVLHPHWVANLPLTPLHPLPVRSIVAQPAQSGDFALSRLWTVVRDV